MRVQVNPGHDEAEVASDTKEFLETMQSMLNGITDEFKYILEFSLWYPYGAPPGKSNDWKKLTNMNHVDVTFKPFILYNIT